MNFFGFLAFKRKGHMENINSIASSLTEFVDEYKSENEFVCMVEEFKSIKEEAFIRLQSQQNLFNLMVILMGAAITVIGYIQSVQQYTLLLALPLIFTLLGFLLLEQENMIDAANQYIDLHLAPRMERFLYGENKNLLHIWEWELFLFHYSSYQRSKVKMAFNGLLGAARFAFPIFPSIVLLLAYWRLTLDTINPIQVKSEDIMLTIVNIVLILILISSTILLKVSKPNMVRQRINNINKPAQLQNEG